MSKSALTGALHLGGSGGRTGLWTGLYGLNYGLDFGLSWIVNRGRYKTWTLDSGLDYGLNFGLDFVLNSIYVRTNSLFTLAWDGYEPVHGMVLKNGSASVYTSHHNRCVYHTRSLIPS